MNEYIVNAVIDLDEKKVLRLVKEAVEEGQPAETVLNSVEEGMLKIGDLYASSSLFIADLIMAGIIFKEVLKSINVGSVKTRPEEDGIGTIVIGSARTDKHDIGKDIFINMARAARFNVIDLGTDVSEETFVEAIKKYRPDIVGISALLTTSMKYMKTTVELIAENGLRNTVKIIIAGNPLSEDACEYVGADYYTKKASDGLKMCLKWVGEGK